MLKEKTPEAIKRLIWLAVQFWPFGYFCQFRYGNLDVAVRKNLWVIISDGYSKDALPMSLVSLELVDRVKAELQKKWYMPRLE